MVVVIIGLIIVGYLFGGIPVGVLVGRTRGVDIRQYGSGNVGASNVLRILGVKAGLTVWLADVFKGFAPVTWSEFALSQGLHMMQPELGLRLVALAGGALPPA